MKADILRLRALDMAAWDARREDRDLAGLVHHTDHGSNYLALVYTDRIVELGAKPSAGMVGDSLDNALAEAVNGLYKTELIRRRGPWRTVEQVELATLEYVWWWNNHRLHGELGYRTPIEAARYETHGESASLSWRVRGSAPQLENPDSARTHAESRPSSQARAGAG